MLIIDYNEASASKEYIICPCHYFLDKVLKFQPNVCNECHDVLMLSINLNNITISDIRIVNYCCIINGISKSDAVKLLRMLI